MMEYDFEMPTKLIVGKKSLEKLQYELSSFGIKKLFVLSDKDLKQLGVLEKVLKYIDIPFQVFTDVPPDSSTVTLREAYDEYFASGCDALLSLGGGSVIDTAKTLAFMLGENQRELFKVENFEAYHRRPVPHICLPTTSGTGSELSHGVVIWSEEEGRKILLASKALCPHVALIDGGLLQSLPPRLTAGTGLDAWTHLLEAIVSPQENPLSRAIALEAWMRLSQSLPEVLKYPKDLDLRLEVAQAAAWAGLAFSHSSLGLAHCLAHAMGGVRKVHHGEAVSLFTLLSLTLTQMRAPERLQALVAAARTLDAAIQDFDSLWMALQGFRNQVAQPNQIPTHLGAYDLSSVELDRIAEEAELDGTHLFTPGRPEGMKLRALLEMSLMDYESAEDMRAAITSSISS